VYGKNGTGGRGLWGPQKGEQLFPRFLGGKENKPCEIPGRLGLKTYFHRKGV